MWSKPFKPPLLKSLQKTVEIRSTEPKQEPALTTQQSTTDKPIDLDLEPSPRPFKKRRLIHIIEDDESSQQATPTISAAVKAPRKPLITVKNPIAAAQGTGPASDGPEGYYLVLWYAK
jgi:hypothetical protein